MSIPKVINQILCVADTKEFFVYFFNIFIVKNFLKHTFNFFHIIANYMGQNKKTREGIKLQV